MNRREPVSREAAQTAGPDPPLQILDTTVTATIVGGDVVFSA